MELICVGSAIFGLELLLSVNAVNNLSGFRLQSLWIQAVSCYKLRKFVRIWESAKSNAWSIWAVYSRTEDGRTGVFTHFSTHSDFISVKWLSFKGCCKLQSFTNKTDGGITGRNTKGQLFISAFSRDSWILKTWSCRQSIKWRVRSCFRREKSRLLYKWSLNLKYFRKGGGIMGLFGRRPAFIKVKLSSESGNWGFDDALLQLSI